MVLTLDIWYLFLIFKTKNIKQRSPRTYRHPLNVLVRCSTCHYILYVHFGLYNLDITTVFTAVSHAVLFSFVSNSHTEETKQYVYWRGFNLVPSVSVDEKFLIFAQPSEEKKHIHVVFRGAYRYHMLLIRAVLGCKSLWVRCFRLWDLSTVITDVWSLTNKDFFVLTNIPRFIPKTEFRTIALLIIEDPAVHVGAPRTEPLNSPIKMESCRRTTDLTAEAGFQGLVYIIAAGDAAEFLESLFTLWVIFIETETLKRCCHRKTGGCELFCIIQMTIGSSSTNPFHCQLGTIVWRLIQM